MGHYVTATNANDRHLINTADDLVTHWNAGHLSKNVVFSCQFKARMTKQFWINDRELLMFSIKQKNRSKDYNNLLFFDKMII